MTTVRVRLALILALVAACAQADLSAGTVPPVTLADLTRSAARIFRGVCRSAEIGAVDIAGARIAATTYTFEVRESLKGGGGKTISFRQVGTPNGGPADLGRAAGLPVYAPGVEYVLFVLPESKAHLTSPAGASRGALEVTGEALIVPRDLAGQVLAAPRDRDDAGSERVPYKALREVVLELLGGSPRAHP